MAEQTGSGYFQSVWKFNGKELDPETGLYYYGARYYDLRTSVWLGVDPLAEKYTGISKISTGIASQWMQTLKLRLMELSML